LILGEASSAIKLTEHLKN